MDVEKYFYKRRDEDGAVFSALLDPGSTTPKDSAFKAKMAQEAGADVILVGGSVGAGGSILDEAVKAIKESVTIPVVLFPGNINGISKYADAIYFLTLLNTENSYWSVEVQTLLAPFIAQFGIQAIPTSYIVLEPGGTVGWVGKVRPVPRNRFDIAVACALAGKYIGSHFVITDSGSGAPEPPTNEFISKIKEALGDIFYIYGGGIRTSEQAARMITAGADSVQVGNAFEKSAHPKEYLTQMIAAVRKAGRAKL